MTSIPAWEQADLNALYSEGMTNGVPPLTLEAIDQAESGGQGGAINSSGYGGFFGLGAGSTYPNNVTVSPQLLETNNAASFEEQASIAASEFASLLQSHQDNNYSAESAYQGGSTEGEQVFQSLGVPNTASGISLTASTSSTSASSSGSGSKVDIQKYNDLASAVGSAQGALPSGTLGKILVQLDGYMNPQQSTAGDILTLGLSGIEDVVIEVFARLIGVAVGVGIVAVGAYMGFIGSGSLLQTIEGQQRIRNTNRRLDLDQQREDRLAQGGMSF